MNICVFGDSITWGAFLPFRVGWANLLRNYLENEYDSYSLYDLGIDANTTNDLIKRFDVEAEARSPNIIIFAIGVNDSSYAKTEDRALVSLDEFEQNLEELAKKALNITNKVMFVGLAKGSDAKTTPLPRSTTGKCYTKERVKKYNDSIKNMCEKNSLLFVDISTVMSDKDYGDGLHPNIEGHKKIFEEVMPVLKGLLYV